MEGWPKEGCLLAGYSEATSRVGGERGGGGADKGKEGLVGIKKKKEDTS